MTRVLYIVRHNDYELWVMGVFSGWIRYSPDINKARRYRLRNARRVAERIGGIIIDAQEFKGANGHGE